MTDVATSLQQSWSPSAYIALGLLLVTIANVAFAWFMSGRSEARATRSEAQSVGVEKARLDGLSRQYDALEPRVEQNFLRAEQHAQRIEALDRRLEDVCKRFESLGLADAKISTETDIRFDRAYEVIDALRREMHAAQLKAVGSFVTKEEFQGGMKELKHEIAQGERRILQHIDRAVTPKLTDRRDQTDG